MALIEAYDDRTGEKRQVPSLWIGHSVLGQHLSTTPPTTTPPRTRARRPAGTSPAPTRTPAAGDEGVIPHATDPR